MTALVQREMSCEQAVMPGISTLWAIPNNQGLGASMGIIMPFIATYTIKMMRLQQKAASAGKSTRSVFLDVYNHLGRPQQTWIDCQDLPRATTLTGSFCLWLQGPPSVLRHQVLLYHPAQSICLGS